MPEANKALKDELFNIETVSFLSKCIKNVYLPLDEDEFINDIISPFNNLELKERIYWISKMIEKHLPDSYITTVNILLSSLVGLDSEGMFALAAYPDYVSTNGCSEEHLVLSLNMLGEFTKWFSAEFAIRRFINEFPEATSNKMLEWSLSDNVHQRRLASEGLRPKLPWAKGIAIDYKIGAKPLSNLYFDDVRYVTRSVANHLNDISKIDPKYVLSTLAKWKKTGKQNTKEMAYIISHSLRTLVKKGHLDTMEFLGYNTSPKIKVSNLEIENPKITIGESIKFSFDILGKKTEQLIIDYKVIYPMARNKTSEKVFKIMKIELKKDDKMTVSKKHPFRLMTTKKLYTGEYKLIIQINGSQYLEEKFYIVT